MTTKQLDHLDTRAIGGAQRPAPDFPNLPVWGNARNKATAASVSSGYPLKIARHGEHLWATNGYILAPAITFRAAVAKPEPGRYVRRDGVFTWEKDETALEALFGRLADPKRLGALVRLAPTERYVAGDIGDEPGVVCTAVGGGPELLALSCRLLDLLVGARSYDSRLTGLHAFRERQVTIWGESDQRATYVVVHEVPTSRFASVRIPPAWAGVIMPMTLGSRPAPRVVAAGTRQT